MKKAMLKYIGGRAGCTQAQAKEAIKAFFRYTQLELADGRPVSIRGCGKFVRTDSPARKHFDVTTRKVGESIPSCKVKVKFSDGFMFSIVQAWRSQHGWPVEGQKYYLAQQRKKD